MPIGIEALYLGGGYPEVFARELSQKRRHAGKHPGLRGTARRNICGMPAAACIFAPRSKPPKRPGARGTTAASGPMCGVIDATARMGGRIRSLGYREASTLSGAPFGLRHETFRGHEFHWSDARVAPRPPPPPGDRSPHPLRRRKSRGRLRQRQSRVCPSLIGEMRDMPRKAKPPKAGELLRKGFPLPRPTSPSGQVILLNGPSSAGKTTLSQALQTRLHAVYGLCCMTLSVDQLLRASTGGYGSVLAGLAQTGLPLMGTKFSMPASRRRQKRARGSSWTTSSAKIRAGLKTCSSNWQAFPSCPCRSLATPRNCSAASPCARTARRTGSTPNVGALHPCAAPRPDDRGYHPYRSRNLRGLHP